MIEATERTGRVWWFCDGFARANRTQREIAFRTTL
jgi:hypothetical protein